MSDIITSPDIHDFLKSANKTEARDRLGFVPVDGAAVDGTSIDFDGNGDLSVKSGGVQGTHLAAGSVSSDKLTTDSVNEGAIVNGSVTEGKVGFQAVTSDKLAANSVTESKIDSGSITTSKLVDEAVTKAKMEPVPDLHVLGNTSGIVDTPKDVTILDDDTMATASDTTLATSESIKAYVNSENVRVSDNYLKYSGSAGNFSSTDDYTDFDLSATVGANRALVVLEVYGGSTNSYFHARTKGSDVTWSDTSGTGWGSSVVVVGPNNQGGTITVVTDDSGVFQHRTDASVTGIQYTIQTYQIIDGTLPSFMYDRVVVSGAGTTSVNGTYVRTGNYDERPAYTFYNTDGTVSHTMWYMSGTDWVITLNDIGVHDAYPRYLNLTSSTSVPLTGWGTALGGNPPAPTLEWFAPSS